MFSFPLTITCMVSVFFSGFRCFSIIFESYHERCLVTAESNACFHSVASLRPGIETNTVKFLNFSNTRKLCCNLTKIQTKRPNLRDFPQNDENIIANSVDP